MQIGNNKNDIAAFQVQYALNRIDDFFPQNSEQKEESKSDKETLNVEQIQEENNADQEVI